MKRLMVENFKGKRKAITLQDYIFDGLNNTDYFSGKSDLNEVEDLVENMQKFISVMVDTLATKNVIKGDVLLTILKELDLHNRIEILN